MTGHDVIDRENQRQRERGDVNQFERGATDAVLVSGDREQFAQLFDRHAATLHRYCVRRVGVDAAEDVVAETFTIAFAKRGRFDAGYISALPWLYGIATNLLRRRRRDEVRAYRALARTGVDPLNTATAAAVDSTDYIAARLDAAAASRQLAVALAKIPARHRDVLLLYAWGQLSYAEIATALRISLGTVRSRLSRAKARLRNDLPALTAHGIGAQA
ncbi:MAG: RNA polymerase sigma factor [Mycobacteriales bacterium]